MQVMENEVPTQEEQGPAAGERWVAVPLSLLNDTVLSGRLKELHRVLMLEALKRDSMDLEYSTAMLKKLTGLDLSVLRRYVQELKTKGLVSWWGFNGAKGRSQWAIRLSPKGQFHWVAAPTQGKQEG